MIGYVSRRVLYAVIVIWAAFTVTFVLLYMLPSDPVSVMLDRSSAENGTGANRGGASVALTQQAIESIKERYGYDKSLPVQYLTALQRMVTGDLGTSINTGIPVRTSLANALPQTLRLAVLALVLGVALGIGLGFLSTFVSFHWLRQALQSLPPLAAAIPTFWFGLILLQIFSFRLGWFPAYGNASFRSLVLPAVTLALPTAAVMAQVLSKGLRDALGSPYIDTARAKGASRSRVHVRHAFRNGLLPALTVIGLSMGHIVAGSVIVETVFARDGIGRLTEQAVNLQDMPVVLAVVVISAACYAIVNLIVDLLYPLVDPRIRRAGASV